MRSGLNKLCRASSQISFVTCIEEKEQVQSQHRLSCRQDVITIPHLGFGGGGGGTSLPSSLCGPLPFLASYSSIATVAVDGSPASAIFAIRLWAQFRRRPWATPSTSSFPRGHVFFWQRWFWLSRWGTETSVAVFQTDSPYGAMVIVVLNAALVGQNVWSELTPLKRVRRYTQV